VSVFAVIRSGHRYTRLDVTAPPSRSPRQQHASLRASWLKALRLIAVASDSAGGITLRRLPGRQRDA
jgi:hypothetical protein